jgi:CBS domain containing-hemolysin-like protein
MTGAWLETEAEVLESRAQLRNRLHSLLEEGELPEERRDEVLGALDVDELSVSEIMVPADDIVALSTTLSVDENFDNIRNTPHTRFPPVGEELTDFPGIVYAPSIIDYYEDLVDGSVTCTEIAAPR